MGIPDSSILDLIHKVGSWIYWGSGDLDSCSGEYKMAKICCDCKMPLVESCNRYPCQRCGRMLCENCVQSSGCIGVISLGNSIADGPSEAGALTNYCKFCSHIGNREKFGKKFIEKVYPSDSPRQSPEPPSPCSTGRSDDCCHPDSARSIIHYSPSRSDDDDREDSNKTFFSSFFDDTSDVDSSSISARHEFYSSKSVGSSPLDSPCRIHNFNRIGHPVEQEQVGTSRFQNGLSSRETSAERPETGNQDPDKTCQKIDNSLTYQDQHPLDLEKNGLIWFPPPAVDENDEKEDNFFAYEDDEDDVGESTAMFSSSDLNSMLSEKDKDNDGQKDSLRAVVQGHFRALVSQLLLGEGIKVGKENSEDNWLDVVAAISWQAANYVRPDTSRGGSMDPVDYVKVKCIASGIPSESKFIKGVVCTKNIKHKRMISQYRNTRLLILDGALEYQRVPNQLASFDKLLQQEIDYLKMIVSRIEAHHPNVLLVERGVSSYAQEYLLAKEISLVLNVKKPLLQRIARCTGASITPIDKLSVARLGHCELFRIEKVSEDLEQANQLLRKPSKTLMFFEGCPRRLGCTVLLKGSCREELKKVKHVVQYAVFAAYHLSLETSFLADEGASLPKPMGSSISLLERTSVDSTVSLIPTSVALTSYSEVADLPSFNEESAGLNLELEERESVLEPFNPQFISSPNSVEYRIGSSDVLNDRSTATGALEEYRLGVVHTSERRNDEENLQMNISHTQPQDLSSQKNLEEVIAVDASSEYHSAGDSHQSILVSFSNRCVLNGTVCERSRLLRIKFYGCFDKPLGRYLQDDLFDQTSCCKSCKEPADCHVVCYTHQQGNLTINVRRLPTVKLPGERDGKIWMWHRCLRCTQIDGVPPATRRVIMSDAAWGLSFGKFLELSFSNHATANRVASCGHSLQRDCLRYYGFGSMVAFFRYSPIDILSVCLPPSVLEFIPHSQQDWLKKETSELLSKKNALYEEILGVLQRIEQKCTSLGHESSDRNELHSRIIELKDQLIKERDDSNCILQPASKDSTELVTVTMDVFELNHLRQSLLIVSHDWDHRLSSLDSRLSSETRFGALDNAGLKNSRSASSLSDITLSHDHNNVSVSDQNLNLPDFPQKDLTGTHDREPEASVVEFGVGGVDISTSLETKDKVETHSDVECINNNTSLERAPSAASELSDKIDSVWNGTADYSPLKLPARRLSSPARVQSFDSAIRYQERVKKGLPPSSLHLSAVRSFHASGDYVNMLRDPLADVQRTSSQILPHEAQKYNLWNTSPSFVSSASLLPKGARLVLSSNGQTDLIIVVYDNEPTSAISYALSSREHKDWIADKSSGFEEAWNAAQLKREDSAASTIPAWQSFGSLDLDYINYGSYGSEDVSTTIGTLLTDPSSSTHFKISFEAESPNAGGRVKFSVTCYFPKQFDALRKKCGCNEVDLVHSLSRCERWNAQGGKSNVYFAKSLDERFIVKQVTKTELESFEEFAPEYFKYMKASVDSKSPTCLAKILGIFQVSVKHLKGGKETKMDLMVMENLFFRRNISRVYDLKGSARSRYNSDTTGVNKVLLDMNLLEALRTKPMFLGSKAKRSLERAVWNDTSFLASVDVMDYSLLVGVDEERNELVLGIIDYMRQYTWDKHLETWVKSSGILGGAKNAAPTIVSPKLYKKRFRKAMTTYFLTVPDQWST
ncbi:1-phosphatidylinositol-3-phosphate 5-kinase [Heracleum sosnowskyi]|uniref:1-phosphatidylinositol-3-phosphate 5-kinase n=1 Tax=Heracleum sosnowskyi TaxID=360622 RepID=A0AAD8I914_9APIA|nr:1-phosphatidylinositol-3-phosphate 5-kinase [Heracleum sosnowskyi]KAK1380814.1 1-phosphatidylinositol-3-phosphate 5-kinase [Heracleum sosnowskyi]